MSVNRQDSDIIVKSIDQSPKSCEFMVLSTVQCPGIVETLINVTYNNTPVSVECTLCYYKVVTRLQFVFPCYD